tara:strand:- start:365 stop:583 length:219 start_codon:yes stop_codon:yes gene_type:complete
MSLESKVGRATLDIMEVAKTKVANGLLEARNDKGLNVSDEDLALIMQHVNAALDATFQSAAPMLTNVLKSKG